MTEADLPRESYIKKQPVYDVMQDWLLTFPEQNEIDQVDITDRSYILHVVNAYRMPIVDVDEFLKQTTYVWTHSAYNEHFQDFIPKFDKAIYIIRDPRDGVLSFVRWVMLDYYQFYLPTKEKTAQEYIEKHLVRLMKRWNNHVLGFLNVYKSLNIHIIFYENLLNDFQYELGQLLDYLEIDLSQACREKIETMTSFENMKQKSPGHLHKAGLYRWFDKFSEEQLSITDKYCGDLISALNYPDSSDKHPTLPGINALNEEVLSSLLEKSLQVPLKERIKGRIIRIVNGL